MNSVQIKILTDAGVNLPEVLERMLNNERVFNNCLRNFLSDSSIEKLNNAAEQGDWTEAFAAAHSIKGVAGNMSFTRLASEASDVVKLLRANDTAAVHLPISRVNMFYEEIKNAINNYFDASDN